MVVAALVVSTAEVVTGLAFDEVRGGSDVVHSQGVAFVDNLDIHTVIVPAGEAVAHTWAFPDRVTEEKLPKQVSLIEEYCS